MTGSTFEWRPDLAGPVGHDLQGTPVPAYVYPEKASGGLLAPVEDVARFVAAGMNGGAGVLSPESVRRLHEPAVEVTGIYRFVSQSYGFGHFVETLEDGTWAAWHGGQGHGWMTHFHAVPGSGDGIVILTNSQRSWPMIAQTLGDWSEWAGIPPVGMTVVSRATTMLWVLVVSVWAVAVAAAALVAAGLARGRRTVSARGPWGARRAAAGLTAVGLLGVVAVAVMTDLWAFFLVPLFPAASTWLAASVLALAASLLLMATAPRTTPTTSLPTAPATSP